MNDNNIYRHYITVDGMGRILNGFSDALHAPSEKDICINERGGYQFRLFSSGKENPPLREIHGIPLYKYEDGAVSARGSEEVKKDVAEIPASLSFEDRFEAQLTYTAMMTDTLLEV